MPQRMETSKDVRFFKSKPNMFFSSSWRNIPTLIVHIQISLPCAPAPSPKGSMLEGVKNGLYSPATRRPSQAILPLDHPPPQCPVLPIPITVLHFSCHLIHGCPTFSIVPLPLDIPGFIQHLYTFFEHLFWAEHSIPMGGFSRRWDPLSAKSILGRDATSQRSRKLVT